MTTRLAAPSPEEWKRYEKSPRERKQFIESYRAEIEMRPITTENSIQAGDHPSSETQGQLVGSIKCSWRKFTVRSRRAPGHLLLPNQFQKRLNCLLLIGQKKIFLANQRREAAG